MKPEIGQRVNALFYDNKEAEGVIVKVDSKMVNSQMVLVEFTDPDSKQVFKKWTSFLVCKPITN